MTTYAAKRNIPAGIECAACNYGCREGTHAFKCKCCNQYYHLICSKLTETTLMQSVLTNCQILCAECVRTKAENYEQLYAQLLEDMEAEKVILEGNINSEESNLHQNRNEGDSVN